MPSPARCLLAPALLAALTLSGCTTFKEHAATTFHNLQPHRLWRLNRHPAPRRDVYYSVSDPIPASLTPLKVDETVEPVKTPDVDAPPRTR